MQAQTRVPDHPLLQAVALGEPTAVLEEEVAIRRTSALPPFAALAVVSGALAPAYAESLRREVGRTGSPPAVPPCRWRRSATIGSFCAPTPTLPSVTCWPALPGRPGGGSASRSTRSRSERRRNGRPPGPDRESTGAPVR